MERPLIPAGAREAELKTADKFSVSAWYFAPQDTPAPGVILLHERGRDKSSWGSLPQQLVRQGFAVISIDLRGHGQTKCPQGRPLSADAMTDADYAAMLQDVAAADAYLRAQRGVDGERIGIIGASIGANLGIIYLAGDRRIRTCVALSPGLDYKGLRPLEFMEAVDKRPVYFVAARGDEYSVESAEQLSQAGIADGGPKSVRLFEGEEHGTDLLAANEGLDRTIASGWLLNYLPPRR